MFIDMNRKIVDEILRFISQNQNVKRSYKKKKTCNDGFSIFLSLSGDKNNL